jgi:TP901 family phage tail tape measure protein
MARLTADLVLGLNDKLSGPARNAGNAIDRLTNKQTGAMGLMRRNNRLTTESMLSMGTASRTALAGAAGVLAPLAGGLAVKEVFTAAADFQASMNRVRAALQTTGPEFAELSALAKEMGRTTQFSANESALAIEMLGKNGLNTSQILGGALKTSMEIAAASGSDLSSSADVVTDVMSNFKLEAKDLGSVANGLTGVLLQSKFGFEDYRLALGQAGGVAGGVGVTMADFNSTIAATSSAFASGSDAGTSFKTFLARLVPASKPAAAAMKKLGLEFFDKNRKMKSMGEIAQELQEGLKGLSDEARNEALQDIFGTDAIRTAFGLAQQGLAGMERIQGKIGDASAKAQADARMEGFWGEWKKTLSALEGLNIELGTSGLGGLESALRGAQSIIGDMQAGLTEFKADLDWKEIGQAQDALSELGGELTKFLGTDTGDAALVVFFQDMARAVNQVAFAINKIESSSIFKVVTGDKAKAAEVLKTDVNPETGRLNKAPIKGGLFPGLTKALAGATDSPTEEPGRIVYPDIKYNPVVPAFADAQPLPPEGDLGKKTGAETTLPRWRDGEPQRAAPSGAKAGPTPSFRPQAEAYPPDQPVMAPRSSPSMDIIRQSMPAPTTPMPVAIVSDTARTAPVVSAREAETSSMDAMVRQFAALLDRAGSFQKGVTGTDVRDEAGVSINTSEMEAAKAAAAATGAAIQTSLAVTATPSVVTTQITAARREVAALAAELRAIPGLSQAASDSANRSRVDFSGVHADFN